MRTPNPYRRAPLRRFFDVQNSAIIAYLRSGNTALGEDKRENEAILDFLFTPIQKKNGSPSGATEASQYQNPDERNR